MVRGNGNCRKGWESVGVLGRSSNSGEDSGIVGDGANPMVLGEKNKRAKGANTSVVYTHSKVLRFRNQRPSTVRVRASGGYPEPQRYPPRALAFSLGGVDVFGDCWEIVSLRGKGGERDLREDGFLKATSTDGLTEWEVTRI